MATSYELAIAGVLRLAEEGAEALRDLTPLWDGPVTQLLHGFMEEQFDTAGRAGGEPWAPLSPTTLALKAERNRDKMGVLRDSNDLYKSLVHRSDPMNLRDVRPQSLGFGTRVTHDGFPYAVAHQTGWEQRSFMGRPIPPRTVRPRPLAPSQMPDAWLQALSAVIGPYLQERLT